MKAPWPPRSPAPSLRCPRSRIRSSGTGRRRDRRWRRSQLRERNGGRGLRSMFDDPGPASAPKTRTYRSRRLPGALNELPSPLIVDGVPPASVDLQGARNDDAIDDRENVVDVTGINAAADKRRK